MQGCQPHTSTNVQNMTSPPSNNKCLVEASHQGQIHGFSWGEGGSTRKNAKHLRFSCQKVESMTNRKLCRLSGRLQT